MPRAIDLSTVSPKRAAAILKGRAAKAKEYQLRKEIILARNKEWREKNPDKSNAQSAAWRSANPERTAELKRRYYENNCETVKARQKQRETELSTPGAIRSVFYKTAKREGLAARDCPDEILQLVKVTTLIKRELNRKKGTP